MIVQLPQANRELVRKESEQFGFLAGLRWSCAATCSIGPTISSSPSRGNLPSLRGSFERGILVMTLVLPGSPRVECFSVANASEEFSTVYAIVRSLFFRHVLSIEVHFLR